MIVVSGSNWISSELVQLFPRETEKKVRNRFSNVSLPD